MCVHVQYTDARGWLTKIEKVPPSDMAAEIQSIVGHIDECEIRDLYGAQKLAVMKLVLTP